MKYVIRMFLILAAALLANALFHDNTFLMMVSAALLMGVAFAVTTDDSNE